VKTLAELQAECARLRIHVAMNGRASKEPYIAALREYHWHKDHPGQPMPNQIMPMLLGSWEDLDEDEGQEIEQDCHAWIIQPKLDGVRALLHIEDSQVRITSRTVSEVNYRLSEFQENLAHLTMEWSALTGTILDGELICPASVLDTGSTTARTSLQATTAILATSPENSRHLHDSQAAHIRFHVFDVLRYCGQDVTPLQLIERQDFLEKAVRQSENPFIETVPSYVVNKSAIHDHIIANGGEGTVWKRAGGIYEPGRRVRHWIKQKRGIEVEAFVSGCKPGNNGHANLVGAIEFSTRQVDDSLVPIAWVSSWTDKERRALTHIDPAGEVILNPAYVGRRALIEGHNHSIRSRRIRHARIRRWLAP
jgi:ATP-dependent DNA ligase